MTQTRRPAFNIPYQESPIQGITDRSWDKLSQYNPIFVEVIQTLGEKPELVKQTPYLSIEDCKALRLDWYNAQRFVKRNGDVLSAYPYTPEIKCHLVEVSNSHAYLEFRVGATRSASIAARRVVAQGGLITGTIEDPRPTPDFATKEEERAHFSAEAHQDREEFQRKLSVMNQAIKDREEAFKWRLQAEALSAYVPFEKALRNLERTYPKLHAVVTSITPEEMADYQDHIKQETMKRSSRELEAELRALPLKNPNAFEDKLLKDE